MKHPIFIIAALLPKLLPGDLRMLGPTTGLLKGEMITLGNSEKVSIRGVIFQKSNSASGLFNGASQSGSVYIRPQPQ